MSLKTYWLEFENSLYMKLNYGIDLFLNRAENIMAIGDIARLNNLFICHNIFKRCLMLRRLETSACSNWCVMRLVRWLESL